MTVNPRRLAKADRWEEGLKVSSERRERPEFVDLLIGQGSGQLFMLVE